MRSAWRLHGRIRQFQPIGHDTHGAATTSTFCMGRFLIDVPAGSTLSGGKRKQDFIQIEPVKAMTDPCWMAMSAVASGRAP